MPLLLLLLGACQRSEPVAFCDGATREQWDPADAADVSRFPDDALTVADPASPTGLRVAVDADSPLRASLPPMLASIAAGLEQRSGFGRMGAIHLRFTRSLGPLPEDSTDNPELMLVDLARGERVPFSSRSYDAGLGLEVQPLRPLAPGTRHALVLTDAHVAADGGCVAPSPALRALLTDAWDGEPALAERYAGLADAVGLDPAAISAAVVFTTHDDTAAIAAIAQAARASAPGWDGPGSCEPWEGGRRCLRRFVAWDHRAPGGLLQDEPAGSWSLQAELWLPPPGEPPAPLALYGHGINSSRGEGRFLARMMLDDGLAVASVDALEHGEHPTNDDSDLDAAAFLGMTLAPPTLDASLLGQNFVQTTLDRMQLISALEQDPDVDGDGLADVDPERLAYMGVSLGGLLGPSLLALDDRVDAAVLPVAGAHLVTFATSNEILGGLEPAFIDLVGGEGAWLRTLALGQATMDPADPAVFAAHVLADPLDARPAPPHVLVPVSVFDQTVPPATGRALARSMALPHVPPVVEPVSLLTVSAPAPLVANVDGTTAGFFQLDRVTEGEGVAPSTHANTPSSPEGRLMITTFLGTWMAGETPRIVDPYAELGTPPLP